jgi:hypothetical protein
MYTSWELWAQNRLYDDLVPAVAAVAMRRCDLQESGSARRTVHPISNLNALIGTGVQQMSSELMVPECSTREGRFISSEF